MISVLDMNDGQIQQLVNAGMSLKMPNPEMGILVEDLLELLLALREIKQLAIKHATLGTGVPADQLLMMLDGKKETKYGE